MQGNGGRRGFKLRPWTFLRSRTSVTRWPWYPHVHPKALLKGASDRGPATSPLAWWNGPRSSVCTGRAPPVGVLCARSLPGPGGVADLAEEDDFLGRCFRFGLDAGVAAEMLRRAVSLHSPALRRLKPGSSRRSQQDLACRAGASASPGREPAEGGAYPRRRRLILNAERAAMAGQVDRLGAVVVLPCCDDSARSPVRGMAPRVSAGAGRSPPRGVRCSTLTRKSDFRSAFQKTCRVGS